MLSVITVLQSRSPLDSSLARTIRSLQPLISDGIKFEHILVAAPNTNLSTSPSRKSSIVQAPNDNIFSQMNTGLEAAKGDSIWFLNPGNQLVNLETLQLMLSRLGSDPQSSFISSGWTNTNQDEARYFLAPSFNFYKNLLRPSSFSQQATIYKKGCFLQTGGFQEKYNIIGDYVHFWSLYLNQMQGEFLKNVLVSVDKNQCHASKFWRLSLLEHRNFRWSLRCQIARDSYRQFLWALVAKNLKTFFIKAGTKVPFFDYFRTHWFRPGNVQGSKRENFPNKRYEISISSMAK